MGLINYRGVSGSNWGINGLNAASANFATAWVVTDPDPQFLRFGLDRGQRHLLPLRRREKTHDGRRHRWNQQYTHDWRKYPFLRSTLRRLALPNYVHGTCAIPLNYEDVTTINPPKNNWPNRYSFRSYHSGGGNFCFADGTSALSNN